MILEILEASTVHKQGSQLRCMVSGSGHMIFGCLNPTTNVEELLQCLFPYQESGTFCHNSTIQEIPKVYLLLGSGCRL